MRKFAGTVLEKKQWNWEVNAKQKESNLSSFDLVGYFPLPSKILESV